MADDDSSTGTVDIAAISDSIGADLFPAAEAEPAKASSEPEPDATTAPATAATESPVEQPVSTPPVRSAPKSWAKEMHDYWGKTDPKVQEYIEKREKDFLDGLGQYKTEAQFAKAFKEAVTPYQQTIRTLGVDEIQAVKSLFNADHQLRYSTPEQKMQHFRQLAQHYGIDLTAVSQPSEPINPALKAIQDELQTVKQTLTARQEAEQREAAEMIGKEVDTFASDAKAHPYFAEVSDNIILILQGAKASGLNMSLQDAYEQAVWANPVTRAKELARVQTEAEAKLKENARLTALPKQRAASINVNSRETSRRAPTEPLGSLDDTIKSTLADLRARAH